GDVCRRIAWMRAEIVLAAASVLSNAYREVAMHQHCACRGAIHAPSRRIVLAGLPLPPSRLHGHTHAAGHDPFQIIAKQQGSYTAISPSQCRATTRITKKGKGRRYMLAASSLQYVSVRHDHAVEVPTENGIDRATGRGPISDRTCSHQAMRPEMSWRSQ